MAWPVVAGRLAYAGALALFGPELGRRIEDVVTPEDTRKYLEQSEQRIVSSGVPYSQDYLSQQKFYSAPPFGKETYYPGKEDVLRAQLAEQEFLARQGEAPGVSQISQAIGMGRVTTGQVGASLGVPALLPQRVGMRQGFDISGFGGGATERQRQAIAQYGVERGWSHAEAVRRAEALQRVGRGEMAGTAVATFSGEKVGNIAAEYGGSKLLPGVTKLVEKTPVGKAIVSRIMGAPGVGGAVGRQFGKSAFSSGVGAVGESVAGTGGAWVASGGKLEDAPYYASQLPGQIVIGGLAGGLIEGPRGSIGALRGYKTSELPRSLQAARKVGLASGAERGLYGVGGLLDVPEIPGDIFTEWTEPRVKARAFGFGGAVRGGRATSQVEAMVKEATVKRSGRAVVPAFSRARGTDSILPGLTPARGGPAVSIGGGGLAPVPGEETRKGSSETRSEAPSETPAIAPGLSDALAQSRAYAPERAPRIPLPFFGLPAAYGAAAILGQEKKRYFNELSLLGRAFGQRKVSAKEKKLKIKAFNTKVKAMKKLSRFERGATLFGRGLGVFNVKKSKR